MQIAELVVSEPVGTAAVHLFEMWSSRPVFVNLLRVGGCWMLSHTAMYQQKPQSATTYNAVVSPQAGGSGDDFLYAAAVGSDGSFFLAGGTYGNWSTGSSSDAEVFSVDGWAVVKVLYPVLLLLWCLSRFLLAGSQTVQSLFGAMILF